MNQLQRAQNHGTSTQGPTHQTCQNASPPISSHSQPDLSWRHKNKLIQHTLQLVWVITQEAKIVRIQHATDLEVQSTSHRSCALICCRTNVISVQRKQERGQRAVLLDPPCRSNLSTNQTIHQNIFISCIRVLNDGQHVSRHANAPKCSHNFSRGTVS